MVKELVGARSCCYETFAAAFRKLDPKPVNSASRLESVPYIVLMLARAAAVKANSVDGAAMSKAMAQVTTASQVPDFVGDPTTGIFSAADHQLQVKPANFGFYPAGPTVDGLLVPAN